MKRPVRSIASLLLFSTLLTVSQATESSQQILLQHKKNYILFYTYDLNDHPDKRRHQEAKYQISFKVPLNYTIADTPFTLFFSYTQIAYWQAFDGAATRPLRAIDHNPEFYFEKGLDSDNTLGIIRYRVGYEHSSNGADLKKTRAYNRLKFQGCWRIEPFDIDLSLWQWMKKRKNEQNPAGDETPGIENYYGYGELALHTDIDQIKLDIMMRNNLNAAFNRGAFSIELLGPMDNVGWYLQWWNGYGESVGEYTTHTNRIGAGVTFWN